MTDTSATSGPPQLQEDPKAMTDAFGTIAPTTVIVPILLAGAAAVFGIVGATSDPTVQHCDGQRMGPGDSCILTGAAGGSGTYAELVAIAESVHWVIPAAGAALVALAVLIVLLATIAWLRDRSVRARLDTSAPVVLGASWPVRTTPVTLAIGFVLFGWTGLLLGGVISGEWDWGKVMIAVPAIFGLVFLFGSRPRRGRLLRVDALGVVTTVDAGRQHVAPLQELRVKAPVGPRRHRVARRHHGARARGARPRS